MKILVWKCSECRSPCYEPYIGKSQNGRFLKPEACAWDEARIDFKWLLVKIEDIKLMDYFVQDQGICEHYFLTQMCKGRGGICPKECDGNIRVCEKNVGVQRSIRVN